MANDFDQFDDLLIDDASETINDPADFDALDSTDLLEDPVEDDENVVEQPAKPEKDEEDDSEENEEDAPDYSDNAMYSFLQSKGVKDPAKIPVTNEDGSEELVDFSNLSAEEQMELLESVADPGLSEEEINTINYFRANGTDLQQVAEAYAQQYLQQYLAQNPDAVPEKQYSIDDYTDDELFLADLQSRFPELSEDELNAELDSAKINEELFNKKMATLRTSYKEREDQIAAEEQAAIEQQSIDLRNSITNAMDGFNEIQLDFTDPESESLVIEDSDKQQIMSYLFDQGSDGNSQFVKDCSDPNTLVELAWFRTQGPKVLSDLSQYWKGVLASERAEKKKLQSKLDKYEKTSTGKSKRDPNPQHGVLSAWNNV